jgi:hypothetical protein
MVLSEGRFVQRQSGGRLHEPIAKLLEAPQSTSKFGTVHSGKYVPSLPSRRVPPTIRVISTIRERSVASIARMAPVPDNVWKAKRLGTPSRNVFVLECHRQYGILTFM